MPKRKTDGEGAAPAKRAKTAKGSSQAAEGFLDYVNASPSPFHAVNNARHKLLAAGFTELHEKDAWKLEKNGQYFFSRNQSALIAFSVGGQYVQGDGGFTMVGAHTDSPCFKVKPNSCKNQSGYACIGVECYGGGLWHTWFDRDLSVAGRVLLSTEGGLEHKLVKIDDPICRINTLAIHLDRGVREAFKFNKETHLLPVIGLLNKEKKGDGKDKHQPLLLALLAEELGVSVDQITDFELCLYDTSPSRIGGLANEFIFSPRLDNLMMSYCGVEALINSSGSLANDRNVRLVALFDNEEIGSTSEHGANSNLLDQTCRRIFADSAPEGTNASDSEYARGVRRSYMVSADMAHAVHPAYSEKHEENHRPAMNQGVVIKHNANQRYATTAVTARLFKEIAKKHNLPVQEFVVRNDSPCGSTIGPMTSSHMGVRVIDIGIAQLSMHSCREVCGTEDVQPTIDLLAAIFDEFAALDATLTVD